MTTAFDAGSSLTATVYDATQKQLASAQTTLNELQSYGMITNPMLKLLELQIEQHITCSRLLLERLGDSQTQQALHDHRLAHYQQMADCLEAEAVPAGMKLPAATRAGRSGTTIYTLMSRALTEDVTKTVAIVVANDEFDSVEALNAGVDLHRVHVMQPESHDQALQMTEQLLASGAFSMVLLLWPNTTILIAKDIILARNRAKMITHACSRFQTMIKATNTAFIMVYPERETSMV